MKRCAGFLILLLTIGAALERRPSSQQPTAFDIVIKNGRVIDGTGGPARTADVAIRGGRIVAVGDAGGAQAGSVIDAGGRVVTPGFIDVHSHASRGLAGPLKDARQLLAQGITTVVLNPDGGGDIDIAAQRATYERGRTGVNVAMYVPHGAIRREVLGMADRAPTPAELDRMVGLVRSGMAAGAIGLSSGLYYAPGSYAQLDEVIAMAKAAAEAAGAYESHIRDEADYNIGVVAAVDEVIRVAEEAHIPSVVAHMKALGPATWGQSKTMVEHIAQARARGAAVWADQYPYDASGTSVVGALIPRWAEVGGRRELLKRIDGRDRGRLLADMRKNDARRGGADKLVISSYEPDRSLEGKSLAQVAKMTGRTAEEAALDLLMKGDVGLISFNMSDDDIALIMQQPFTMTCTDGDLVSFGVGKPHPRGNGAFARKIRLYVNEKHVIELPFAIRSMTSLPAGVYGMKDRGVIREGAWADLLVFDPAKVRDAATYQNPHQLSEGFDYVFVNGALVKDNGTFTGKLPGTIVTPQRN